MYIMQTRYVEYNQQDHINYLIRFSYVRIRRV